MHQISTGKSDRPPQVIEKAWARGDSNARPLPCQGSGRQQLTATFAENIGDSRRAFAPDEHQISPSLRAFAKISPFGFAPVMHQLLREEVPFQQENMQPRLLNGPGASAPGGQRWTLGRQHRGTPIERILSTEGHPAPKNGEQSCKRAARYAARSDAAESSRDSRERPAYEPAAAMDARARSRATLPRQLNCGAAGSEITFPAMPGRAASGQGAGQGRPRNGG